MSNAYTATIGLEVHAELKTKSKMFCGCKNDPHNSKPNSYICPVCLAHPGTLPVPNEEAISMVLLFGRAVDATAATYSEFDRKNYFYPDIPKAYQISQYAFPFLTGGSLNGVELTRVHLKEDTARSQHEQAEVSLVDFNRAGVPLMELVTEPVIHDAKTAGDFARELQLLMQTINISDAQMERGEMRVEANISVSKTDKLGTKVEVKNLNSFKSVEGAIAYEIDRQIELLEKGEVISQETRGWDEVKLRTYTQRTKESAKDYRYFPDPDISKINVSTYEYFNINRLDEILPELPENKRIKYKDIGLPINQIELLISIRILDKVFSEIFSNHFNDRPDLVKMSANYLTSDVLSEIDLETTKVLSFSSINFTKLMNLLTKGLINSRIAKDLLKEMIQSDFDPEIIAKERGLLQTSDPASLRPIIDEVIVEFKSVVDEYKAGKESSIQFLVGQVMKKTRGTANPAVLMSVLKEVLDSK